MGTFSTPTLASLRSRAHTATPGTLRVTHEAPRGHRRRPLPALPAREPRRALSGGIPGQTRDRQLNTLDGLAAALGAEGAYWDIKNGYTHSDTARLTQLRTVLAQHDRDALLGAVKIGLQTHAGVDFSARFTPTTEPTHVSQAFCSALSCGYTNVPLPHWEPLATLVLDAAYEATLLAAVVERAAHGEGSAQSPKVWLTFLGGGVFGNRTEWIAGAIGRALARVEGLDLDVRIAHYRSVNTAMQDLVARAREAELAEGAAR